VFFQLRKYIVIYIEKSTQIKGVDFQETLYKWWQLFVTQIWYETSHLLPELFQNSKQF